jgi:LacI family transcriptional regulator
MPPKTVSVLDIARRVGVSRQVVSKVLNGGRSKAAASEETRKRIHRVAEQLGYRPNSAAQDLARGRFGHIGLLMSTHPERSALPHELLRGLHDGLAERQLHLTITMLDDARLTSDQEVPRILTHAMVDGLLVNYTHGIPPRMSELIAHYRIPCVWLNVKRPANAVYPDDIGAGAAATRRLLEAGHRRIAFVDFTYGAEPRFPAHYSVEDRRSGYEDCMRSAGLEPRLVRTPGLVRGPDGIAAARACLSRADRPTAIVAQSTRELDLLLAGARELGLKLPAELSLITCVGWGHQLPSLPLDALVVPEWELGSRAVAMLGEAITSPTTPQAPLAVPFVHQSGQSIAPPPA